MASKEFTYEVQEHLVDLSEPKAGWVKQLNKVSWNGAPPVLDIRPWHYPYGEELPDKMGKGITLSKSELKALYEYLKTHNFDEIDLPF